MSDKPGECVPCLHEHAFDGQRTASSLLRAGAEQVIYAHCHGESRFHDSIEGDFHGIRYNLVSGDFLKRHPLKVLD